MERMAWLRKAAKRVALGISIVLVLVFAMPFYGAFYNTHISPLGRLAKSVHEGDRFEDVREKFVAYFEKYQGQHPVQFSEFESETDLLRTREIPKANGLHLYDETVFDDVQLSVLFDSNGRVSEKLFIGD
jgi:hypothetical protein